MSTGPTPEWDEGFAWAFDSPPKGQKLHISCKNKSKFGKVSLVFCLQVLNNWMENLNLKIDLYFAVSYCRVLLGRSLFR